MLSSDQLSKLKQLKQDIHTAKDIAEGIVRTTTGRFGFVRLDDGRDIALKPKQMKHVFPGDRVRIEVTKNNKEKYEAKLKKLLNSFISHLSGRYQIRGNSHFIATDLHNFYRWIFIPPQYRGKCQKDDYVTAIISQHPFKDGRAQARITEHIGNDNTPYIEKKYTIAKFQMKDYFSSEIVRISNTLHQKTLDIKTSNGDNLRQDLRHIAFITIDSAGTKDIDDALAIEKIDKGWILSVAIADLATDIPLNSPLDNIARKRAQTSYFSDKPLPMLPDKLSIDHYSLKRGEDRLSFIFQCKIEADGNVSRFAFISAIITSHGKLSYNNVAALLQEEEYKVASNLSDPATFKKELIELQACSQALHQYRQQHHIVIENKTDCALFLNEKGKLQYIKKIQYNCAHRIVEEAMLVTNRCAGNFLARHHVGLYVNHRGYKEERRHDIEMLITEKVNAKIVDTNLLTNYVNTIKKLQSNEKYARLLLIQQHFLATSHISNKPAPHFGLGFNYYATITSPIRRYQDLYNQRTIQQLLAGKQIEPFKTEYLTQLHQSIKACRDAPHFMNQWLISDYMSDKIGEIFLASISLLTSKGVGIRLIDTGVEGFILATKQGKKGSKRIGDKISFNNQKMELFWNNKAIALNQTVSVTLSNIDYKKKKLEFRFTQ